MDHTELRNAITELRLSIIRRLTVLDACVAVHREAAQSRAAAEKLAALVARLDLEQVRP